MLCLLPLFPIREWKHYSLVPQTRNLGIILNASRFFTFHIQTTDQTYPLHAISFANTLSSMASSFHALITMVSSNSPQLSTLHPSSALSTRKPWIFLNTNLIMSFHAFTSFNGLHSLDRIPVSQQSFQGHEWPSPDLQPSLSSFPP